MTFKIIENLNWGWEAETDQELICNICKVRLSMGFYYCEQNDIFYCKNCISEHHNRFDHEDWLINKINIIEK